MEKDIYEVIAKILHKHGQKLVDHMEKELDKPKNKNTGDLADSINLSVQRMGTTVNMTISMNDYGKFVNDGRKAGKFPNIGAIREWVKSKGIKMKKKPKGLSREKEVKTLSYLIGRKIKEKGIKAKKFIPTVDLQSIRLEILHDLKQYLIVEVQTEIENYKKKS